MVKMSGSHMIFKVFSCRRIRLLLKIVVYVHFSIAFFMVHTVKVNIPFPMSACILSVYLIATARILCLMEVGQIIHHNKFVQHCRGRMWKVGGKILDVTYLSLHLYLVACFWRWVDADCDIPRVSLALFIVVHDLIHILLCAHNIKCNG